MEKTTHGTNAGGVGVGSLLLVAFIVLKLCHVIDWSWWWVLSPLWISAALVLVIVVAVIIANKIK